MALEQVYLDRLVSVEVICVQVLQGAFTKEMLTIKIHSCLYQSGRGIFKQPTYELAAMAAVICAY